MSKFQTILLSVFGAAIIAAVLIFSLARGSGTVTAKLTVWGPFSSTDFNNFLQNAGLATSKSAEVTYVQKDPASFDADFTEALAEGKGPDLVIVSQDQFWQEKNKLLLIPYANVSQNDFVSTFLEEGDLFTVSTGIYALPLVVDPMVLYSNRDLLTSASLSEPPQYWDQLYNYATALTQKDGAGNITQAMIALGESANIPHAKDILSLLMLQAGTPVTDFQNGSLVSELQNGYNLTEVPAQSALDFYTQFSNPEKPFYSWNRSLESAQTNFVSGNSAFYLGYASELPEIKAKNPNLNVGVSAVPQSRVASKVVTFGTLYGIALSKNTLNSGAALGEALAFVSSASDAVLASTLSLPPVRRDLLSVPPKDGVTQAFYTAAIQAKGWVDPNTSQTATIFTNMIDSVTSGRAQSSEALSSADQELTSLLKQ